MTPQPAGANQDFDPILIVGHSRSGTTMLARLFDRHSQLAVPTETRFFLPAYRKWLRLSQRAGTHRALLDYLRGLRVTYKYSEEAIAARFAAGPPTPFHLFRCLLQDYAAFRGKPRCGEKTPWHILAVPMLLANYPRAKVICLLRDGRDVVESCVKWSNHTWEPKWYHALTWRRLAALAEEYMRRYPGRFVICRFEDLLEDPGAEMKRLDEFAGIPFEPHQIADERGNGAQLPDDWDQLSSYWKERVTKPPDRSRAYVWRRSRDAREIQFLTALMNPYLIRYGYDSYSSPCVAGPRGRYFAYRALGSLLQISQISSSLSAAVVRSIQRQRRMTAASEGLSQARSAEHAGP
jgi:hypothetical protein